MTAGASSSTNLSTTSAWQCKTITECVGKTWTLGCLDIPPDEVTGRGGVGWDHADSPRSRGWGSPRWRRPPSGRGSRCLTLSWIQISAQLRPIQTCTDSCCPARPRTPPPGPFSGCAAGRTSNTETRREELRTLKTLPKWTFVDIFTGLQVKKTKNKQTPGSESRSAVKHTDNLGLCLAG